MSRRFWFFTSDAGNTPHFPATPEKASHVAPIYMLGTAAAHKHAWLGGICRPDAGLAGADAMHYHDIVEYQGTQYQLTTPESTPAHSHDIPESPSYWLVCATVRDADLGAFASDPAVYPLAEVVDGVLSNDAWDQATFDTWETRFRVGLALDLPSVVNRDMRLVDWLKTVVGLRGSETGYRCPE